MKIDDEVITLVKKSGIPSGTFGMVSDVEGDYAWVDVYIPCDADIPEDTVRYHISELKVQ